MWYDGQRVLDKDCLFNFIVGGRGIGKSFFWKKYCLERFRDSGEQFIYLRRYKEELKPEKMKRLFNDLKAAGYFPDDDIEVKGREIHFNKKVCGYVQALSTALIAKSDSFPQVQTILFDEFLIETGAYHYLRNEVEALLGFYETVARNRECVKIFLLSNAITITNPYFNYFNIKLPDKDASIWRRGDILLHMPKDNEFIGMRSQSRFGKMIAGSLYSDYSINNRFYLDDETFIERKTARSHIVCNFGINGVLYGMWIDPEIGRAYISLDHDQRMYTYSLTVDGHNINSILIGKYKPFHLAELINYYRSGCLRFESQKIKGITMSYLKKVV